MEDEFIAAIAADSEDNETRLVYADWLTETGQQDQCDYLKLEIKYHAAATEKDRSKFRVSIQELKQKLPQAWLLKVLRIPIENCAVKRKPGWDTEAPDAIEFHFQCERNWESLTQTAIPKIRNCSACDESVTFAESLTEARQLANQQKCVALCPSISRKKGDLATRVLLGRIRSDPERD